MKDSLIIFPDFPLLTSFCPYLDPGVSINEDNNWTVVFNECGPKYHFEFFLKKGHVNNLNITSLPFPDPVAACHQHETTFR